jgi:hypothetical protein
MAGSTPEDEADAASAELEDARTRLSAGIDNARRLVQQARFMLGGENDESPA